MHSSSFNTPNLIRKPKTLHPAQKPKKASKKEKTDSRSKTIIPKEVKLLNTSIEAVNDRTIPIPAANFLGLKITILFLKPATGIIIFFETSANKLYLGVKNALKKKSTNRIAIGIKDFVKIAIMERVKTRVATPLTPCSFTL